MKKNRREKERVLTPKEQARSAKIQKLSNEKIAEGYQKKELTISIVYANMMALILGLPICLAFVIPFFVHIQIDLHSFDLISYFLWIIAVFASVVIHELIHGLFWGLFAKEHFKSIEFGFIKEYLTPYCTCLEPLSKLQYILGTVMPGVILGILPMAVSLCTGSVAVLLYGVIMTIGAGGDFTIILKLLRHHQSGADVVYVDHPTKCGLIVFER